MPPSMASLRICRLFFSNFEKVEIREKSRSKEGRCEEFGNCGVLKKDFSCVFKSDRSIEYYLISKPIMRVYSCEQSTSILTSISYTYVL